LNRKRGATNTVVVKEKGGRTGTQAMLGKGEKM